MTFHRTAAIEMIVLLSAPVALLARQSILLNGSLEFGPGPYSLDPHNPAGWTRVGTTCERSDEANLVPPGAGHAFKAFSSDPQVYGYQDVTAAPGNSVAISGWLYTRASDKLSGDARAGIVLEFLNSAGNVIGSPSVAWVLNAASPADQWIFGSAGAVTAPAGTVTARYMCMWQWFGSATGAALWDDCQLTINGGPNLLTNGDFETAGISEQSPFGIDDWSAFGYQEQSGDVSKDGVKSVLTAGYGLHNDWSGIYQAMATLSAGDHIYTKGWAWIPSSDPLTGAAVAGLKLEFHANGQVPPAVENLAFTPANDPNQWTLIPLTTTVPDGISIARISCIFVGSSNPPTTGSVYFDGAWAERGSQPGVNQLLNTSFESGGGGVNGIDNWNEFGTSTRKSCFVVPAYQGNCTARSTGTEVTGIYQEMSVTPGETVTAHVYAYTRGSDPLLAGSAGIKVEWRFGGVPDNIDIGPASRTVTASSAHDTWLPLYIDYTMPAGSNAIVQYTCLYGTYSQPTGRVYFDACEGVVLNKFNGSDADGDNDEDLLDFAQLQRAFNGSGGMLWNGIVFDSDNNQHVDMADYNYFAARMTGPAQ